MTSIPISRSVGGATAPTKALTLNFCPLIIILIGTVQHCRILPPGIVTFFFLVSSSCRSKLPTSLLEMAVPTVFPVSNVTFPGTLERYPALSSILTGSSSIEISLGFSPKRETIKEYTLCTLTKQSHVDRLPSHIKAGKN